MPVPAQPFATPGVAGPPAYLEQTGPLGPGDPFERTDPLESTEPDLEAPRTAQPSTAGAEGLLDDDTQPLDGAPQGATTPAVRRPQIDQVGRYRLQQCLGQGGVGTVWSAYDTVLARQVAVKTLTIAAEPGRREALAARVLDEARAAARLSHPYIVTVHDAGVSPDGAYIAMEMLRGQDLCDLLRSGWRPGLEQTAMIVRRVADALGYAHSKGVIHCDIKPANIFLVGRTRPIVLDFGIARLIHHGQSGPAVGSPYYASPEQIDGRECDPRSDVYSLGVVLYELLTGQRPYTGSNIEDIREAIRLGQPVRPAELVPEVPAAIETLALQAIDPDPAARPRSAGAMARELRTWLAAQASGGTSAGPAPTPPGARRSAPREVTDEVGAEAAPPPYPGGPRDDAPPGLPPALNPAPFAGAGSATRSASSRATPLRSDAPATRVVPASSSALTTAMTVVAVLAMLALAAWWLIGHV